jgi:hypothetical protein
MRYLSLLLSLLISTVFFGQIVEISHYSGKYDGSISVEIAGDFTKAYYSIDGSKPSRRFSKPIEISKSTFLKIKPVFAGDSTDTLISRTYILNFETKLPILSIGVDEDYFWDKEKGIYVLGAHVYKDTTGHWSNANYQKKWERPIHIIYLDTNNQEGFNQKCGIKIFGESTRRQPDKSMKIIARSEYGTSRFQHRIFPQKDISAFKQLVIRTSGNDYKGSRFKDVLNAYLVRNMGLDYMAYQPIQLFINGQYWGLYNLREKVNEHYLFENHGANRDSSSIIMGRWVRQHGSSSDYMKMYNWFMRLDTMDNEAYEKAKTLLDIRNYINYRVFQIYLNNTDSRGNIRYWNSKDLDGKFRMILYDTDLSFGTASRKYLVKCLSSKRTDWFNPEWSTFYLRKLMQNDAFKNDFINQMAHLMNTAIHRDTIIAAVDKLEGIYKDELPRNGKLLAPHLKRVPLSEEEWLDKVDHFRMYAKLRHRHLRPEMVKLLAPKGMYTLKIAGDIGSIVVNGNYPIKLPFEGIYYKDIPLPIKAIESEEWQFIKWSDGDTSQVKLIHNLEDTLLVQPLYEKIEREVVIESSIENVEKEATNNAGNELMLLIGYALLGLGFLLLLVYVVLKITKR